MQYVDPAAAAFFSTDGKRCPIETSWTSLRRPSVSSQREGNPRSERSCSISYGTTISIEEYEALPRLLKKKYFSSRERLHLAREASSQRRRKRSFGSGSWKSGSTGSESETRPSTSQGISMRGEVSQRRAGDAKDISDFAALDMENISEEQARWFATLPDKIRKQQFSRKEQVSLAVRCKRVLQASSPDLADDVLRRCLYGGRENDPSPLDGRLERTSAATVDTDILTNEGYQDSIGSVKRDPEHLASGSEMYDRCRRPSSSVNETEITALPPIALSPQGISSVRTKSRSSSLSRASEFASMSLPSPELSAIPPVPPLPPPDQLHFARPRALTSTSSRQRYAGPTSEAEEPVAEAKHYQQLDVRKQLRQHLSPQKFDEAIEFGFVVPNEERALSSSATNRSFSLRPIVPGLTNDVYADDDSNTSPDTLSPRTPPTYADHLPPVINKSSFDSSTEIRPNLFTALKTSKKRSPESSLGNREMTIHMTLTRRDLRAPDEDVSGTQRPTTSGVDVERVDPLTLDPLLICNDPSGSQGAFAISDVKSKGLKRVWKSLRGR